MKDSVRILICGSSGAGKSTIAQEISTLLKNKGYEIDIVDADDPKFTFEQLDLNHLSIKKKFSKKIKIDMIKTAV